MNELIQWARALKNQHPDKFGEIWELVCLCQDEIDDGNSPIHEIALCKESIKQLINN